MDNLYTNGQYLENTSTWHAEDSHWKAIQIDELLSKNKLAIDQIAEIGTGSGQILQELNKLEQLQGRYFSGYDISNDAITLAKKQINQTNNITFELCGIKEIDRYFDLLLAIDVFEHVPDYMGFLTDCNAKARYKIYHIPLDIHVSSVLRNAFVKQRANIGHIHYFTAESALAVLEDTGHTVIDYTFTNVGTGLFWKHPSLKKAIANIPRWAISLFSKSLAARVLGGYSLLVLCE